MHKYGVLLEPTDDEFYNHPAAPAFYRTAISLGGTIADTDILVSEIVEQGSTVANEQGVSVSAGEAAALAYLAKNRVVPREGEKDA